jgi:hypothetical protein
LLCCYFAANQFPKPLSFAFEAMSIEMMAMAALSVDPALQRSQELLDRVSGANDDEAMRAIEDSMGEVLTIRSSI